MRSYIKSISIDHVRHLKNLQIDILEGEELKHLILTGKNGSGKTSVLERIKAYLKSIQDGNYTNVAWQWEENIKERLAQLNNFDKVLMTGREYASQVQWLNNEIQRLTHSLEAYKDGIDVFITGEKPNLYNISNVGEKYKNSQFILAYFPAKRAINIKSSGTIKAINLDGTVKLDENLDDKFLDYLKYLKFQLLAAKDEGDLEEVPKIENWFLRLENALQELFEQSELKLKFNSKKVTFIIEEPNRESYDFNQLSDGYSAVLDIIINLIMRMEKTVTNAYDIEGIVLIDEIETHLHIRLQAKILPFLTKFFPKIQFIVTTHSPVVLGSIENAVIYDLEKQLKVEDLSGVAYSGIVEGYFDFGDYSKIIQDKLDRYEILVFKTDKTEDEDDEVFELRQYLKSISGQLSPEVSLKFNTIELARRHGGSYDKTN
ncbi:MAG: hypothetical protein ATN33_05345 [Epulopiscium sp. Nele67-Bin001]|nr:MAG: hypothetical protein ATN33_05345 [Epulopiscium sp. Nele67-Bin001]